MSDDVLRVVALTIACLLGLWTAVACRRAHYHGFPGSDALVWAGLSVVFFLLSLMKTVRGLGLLRGFGGFLRDIFKQRGWYEPPKLADCGKHRHRRCRHRFDRLGPSVGLALH